MPTNTTIIAPKLPTNCDYLILKMLTRVQGFAIKNTDTEI